MIVNSGVIVSYLSYIPSLFVCSSVCLFEWLCFVYSFLKALLLMASLAIDSLFMFKTQQDKLWILPTV